MGRVQSPEPGLVAAAGRALAAVRIDDEAAALAEVTEYIDEAERPAGAAGDVVMLLFGTCSEFVAALGAGTALPVQLQVFDAEGQELSIDDAEPPVRTAVRTLLAEVHGDTDSARTQVDIALASADQAEMNTVLLQALRWTVRLADECVDRELTVPEWVATALPPD